MNAGALFLIALSLMFSGAAQADEFQPLTVRISQSMGSAEQGYIYRVETRVPNDQRIRSTPLARLPATCEQLSERLARLPDQSLRRTESYRCPQSLHGASIALEFGGPNPGISTLISVELEDNTASTALPAHQYAWTIPDKLSSPEVASQYAGLGFKHLLTGFDHLLFVACLLFICLGRWRKLVVTITAFTIAHSLSLGLNAFGMLALNVRAVEAIIALSIVYLASDIIRHTLKEAGSPDSLSYRHPATVAGAFGLLHGLGFANILNEFGLPQGEKLIALFSFNIGIEIGQLVFIAALLLVASLAKRLIKPLSSTSAFRGTALSSSYLVGTIAMFWTIERIANAV